MRRSRLAQFDGDEAAFARVTDVRSPHGFVRGRLRHVFASRRLHAAVEQFNVTKQRTVAAGFDPQEDLRDPATPRTPEARRSLLETLDRLTWTETGDTAVARATKSAMLDAVAATAHRAGSGWVVVEADPAVDPKGDPSVETLTYYGRWSQTRCEAVEDAIRAIEAGQFKTILQVNDFIEARQIEIERRSPTTQPAVD